MDENSFIPEKDADLYKSYTVQMFRMVPKNAKLICQNVFNGGIMVKGRGFNFIAPWYRSKLVNIAKTIIDYPKEKYLTKDGIYVEVDPALTVRIVDPVKFEFENTNPTQELGVLVKDVIRSFIASKNAGELIGTNYSVEEKDPCGLFGSFERRVGLHISHLFFKNIELPKELVDDFEKAKTQELENKRAVAEAKSKREQAEINAAAKKIDADAEAYRHEAILGATVELLYQKGYDEKTISDIVKTILISGSKANVIASLGNTNSQEAAAALILSALGKNPESEVVKGKKKIKVKEPETL